MNAIGAYALPLMIGLIIAMGLIRQVGIFDEFLAGARDGMTTLVRIIPTLVGMIVAVEMFKASGALDVITHALAPASKWLGIPAQAMPLAILRPISGGGSVALLDSILGGAGPDSLAGRVASVMCGSSETTFYTIAVYYGSCGVKKTRHTIAAALAADFTAAVVSALSVRLLL